MKTKLFLIALTLSVGINALFADDLTLAYCSSDGSTKYYKTAGGLYFNIDASSKTATLMCPSSGVSYDKATINVPEIVTYESVDYKVTSIKTNAHLGGSSTTTISLPKTIKTINVSAFGTLSKITTFRCNATTPPTIYGTPTFLNNIKNRDGACSVYVPCGSVDTYSSESNWSIVADYLIGSGNYTITFKNDDGTTLQTKTNVSCDQVPSYSGSTPTKASTAQYTYSFKGWTPTIVAATANATYTATYTQTLRQYTITWKNDDGTTLKSEKVNYGVTPSYSGSTPTKASTAEYTYTFKAWSPTIVSVSGDKTYTATYTATKRKYTITWKNDDGTQIDQTSVEYGATPTHANPTKASTAEYTYTFKAWSPTIASVTGNKTYTATYTATKRKYTITFNNYDNTQLQSSSVEYGKVPAYTNGTPTKPATAEYTYTFKGWTPEIVSVTGPATYTAVFDSVKNVYQVTWVNADGSELNKDSLEYGEMPEYNGETPIKDSTAVYAFFFAGWAPDITSVTGDATYTAKYDSTKIVYDINIAIPDTIESHGTVTIDGEPTYGDTITVTATPEDGWYFEEWSDGNTDNPREIEVTGDVEVYPIFKECEPIATILNEIIDKGDSYIMGDSAYTERGSYQDTLIAANGCDSVVILNLNIRYTIDVTIPDSIESHGSVTVDGEPTYGDTITVTATSEDGWYFEEWSDGNTDNPREIEITSDTVVYPIFKECEEIIVNISQTINKGQSFTFGGQELTTRGTYRDTVVLANGCDSIVVLKLNVLNSKVKFNLRVVVNDETMGTVSGTGAYVSGSEVTITATPASSKYIFVRWYNEDEGIDVYENPYTFTLTRNLQLRAVFRKAPKRSNEQKSTNTK